MKPADLLPLFLRQFALSLATLCLFAQALVPSGFMLASGEGGFPLSVTICGQNATVPAAGPGFGHGDQDPADESRDLARCAFAGAGVALAAPDMAASSSAPVAYGIAVFAPAARRAALSVGANAPPPSRAPPHIV